LPWGARGAGSPSRVPTNTDSPNPWLYASKRFDPELSLIYFGKRYYNPHFGRWLTTDPAGFIDSVNLYQYVLNNPFKYVDPDGQFIIEIGLGVAFAWKALIAATAIGCVTYAIDQRRSHHHFENQFNDTVHEIVKGFLAGAGGISQLALSKNTDVYAPDRPLPRDERTQEPVPEIDVPHTQLGTKTCPRTGEKYPQAREFDKNGKPVRDIDFTNHRRPKDHPNPHQHKWRPNKTGGTPTRSKQAEPLE
jgi:RHS repeat-associated protein